jgi:quercetin dioxygenase-like cupin family protein
MKSLVSLLAGSMIAGIAMGATAAAQTADAHKVVAAQDVKWGPGPAALPAGAEVAVLYGDPGKEGTFAMRARMPKGYRIGPHTHPKPEIVTVLSGTARLGMGASADPATAQVLPAGSFFVMAPGMAHYISIDEDTVIQINTTGPWGLTYLDPKDDPRQKTQ